MDVAIVGIKYNIVSFICGLMFNSLISTFSINFGKYVHMEIFPTRPVAANNAIYNSKSFLPFTKTNKITIPIIRTIAFRKNTNLNCSYPPKNHDISNATAITVIVKTK